MLSTVSRITGASRRSTELGSGVGSGPGFVAPLLPTLVAEPPSGEVWIHEIKHDGYRTLVAVDRGRATAFTRNGHDWTRHYARVVECAGKLGCRSAVLDGEMIVQDERGVSDFDALRRAMSSEPHRLAFFAFDLLHLDGEDLRGRPLRERREVLRRLIGPADPFCPIQFSDGFEEDGAALFRAADLKGLEGIVSKKAESRYRSGRSTAWLKTKCMTESEFVLVGMELNEGGAPFALLARESEAGLEYAGSAFLTLPRAARDEFWSRTEALKIARAALPELRRGKRKASFVRPELRVRARHLRGSGMLRHAAVTGLIG